MRKQRLLIPVLILAAAGLAAFGGRAMASYVPAPPAAQPTAAARLETAWQNAKAAGRYRYGAEVAQTTHPTARFENQGLSSKTQHFRLDGAIDLSAQTMDLKIWTGEGSVDSEADALQLKVADGKSLGRTGAGAWHELEDASALFAPEHDALSFLVAARNVAVAGTGSSAGIGYTRFAFTVDGPAYAEYMRGRMDDELRRRGKLPAQFNTSVIRQYVDMTSSGEIWVSDAGLPLREIVRMSFPPQGLEWVDAEISTDFTDWGETRLALGAPGEVASPSQFLERALTPAALARLSQAATLATIALCLAAFLLLLTRYGGSRRVYRMVVVSVIGAMVFGPLLQTRQVSAFIDDQQAAKTRADERAVTEAQQQRLETVLNANDFNPNVAPLTAAAGRQEAERQFALDASTQNRLVADAGDPALDDTAVYDGCEKITDADDPDNDGLTNIQEEALGANPCDPDSDNDGIPDGAEVVGFSLGGLRFYLDPQSVDSDRDGLPDSMECDVLEMNADPAKLGRTEVMGPFKIWERQSNTSTAKSCEDTDADGLPDVWDDDSDADGVPDGIDLAPTTVLAGGYDGAAPAGFANQSFDLAIKNPTSGKPLMVEFQLRPANSDHLFLRQNVLDWAKDDRKGQVQRVKDSTYGTSGRDANGNMRLNPYLEILVTLANGNGDGLPVKAGYNPVQNPITRLTPLAQWLDREALSSFGISVKSVDTAGNLVVYVPIQVVRDTVGTKPVAFSATMFYRPGAPVGWTSQAKLVWLIEAMTDYCDTSGADPKGDSDAYDKWCAGTTHWKTVPDQVIHAYYDDWFMTGMSLREDRGLKVGVLFEDPTYASTHGFTATSYYEDKLWQMSDNIEGSFLAGRATMSVDELKKRFDVGTSYADGAKELWGFPKGMFRIVTYSLESQAMMAVMAMTNTPALLNQYFTPTAATIDAPTLLFVREETFRALAQAPAGRSVASNLAFDLSETMLPAQTTGSVNWAPYRYKGARVWEPYPIAEYVDRLHARLGTFFSREDEFKDKYVLAGALLNADAMFVARFMGATSVVRVGTEAVTNADVAEDDDSLAAKITGQITATGKLAKEQVLGLAKKRSTIESAAKRGFSGGRSATDSVHQTSKYLETIGQGAYGENLGAKPKLKKGANTSKKQKAKDIATVVITKAMIAGATYGAKKGATAALGKTGDTIMTVIETVKELKDAVVEVRDAYKAIKTAKASYGSISAAAKAAPKVLKNVKAATATVGLVIEVGVAVGMFFLESANMKPGSDAYDQAVVMLVATIIVAVILTVIASIPIVGQLIAAVIALIDVIAGAICKALGVEADPDGNSAKDWLCNGLTGLLTKAVAKFIFSSNPIVNLNDDKRRVVGGMQQDLTDPSKGFQEGNGLKVSFKITSTIVPNEPNSWMAEIYSYHYEDYYLVQTEMVYALQLEDADLHNGLRTTSNGQYRYWKKDASTGRFYTVAQPSVSITLTHAGLNQATRMRLAEGVAINKQKCGYFLFTVVCWLTDESKTTGIPIDDMRLDVFPDTFAKFYDLVDRGNDSYALAWDSSFPTLCDVDGDGLRSKACGGGDPNDRNPDSDNDGLSDFDEIVTFGTNPINQDTDADGLTDYQEVRANSDPLQADSDGDGLFDCEEVAHRVTVVDSANLCGSMGAWSGGWLFIYAFTVANQPLRTRVLPNPASIDSDGDGILDNKERIYGFNPQVFSRLDVLSINAEVFEDGAQTDGFVGPGQALTYTARLKNFLNDKFGQGLLDVVFPAAVTSADLLPQPFVLQPRQTIIETGRLTVSPSITATQLLTLTNRAGAEITDLYGNSNEVRTLWLHFDESPGATAFVDSSVNQNTPTCVACPLTGQPGYIGLAPLFSGTQYIGGMSTGGVKLIDSSFSVAVWVSVSQPISGVIMQIGPYGAGDSSLVRLSNGRVSIDSVRCSYVDCRPSGAIVHGSITASAPLPVNAWHEVVFRYDKDKTEQAIFIDGRLDVAANGLLPLWSPGPIYIGNGFKGNLDEVQVFNRALSDVEIGARASAPVLRLKFDGDFKDASPFGQKVQTQKAEPPLNNPIANIYGASRTDVDFAAGKLDRAAKFTSWVYESSPESNNPAINDGYSNAPVVAVAASKSLDMSKGRFTQAFWIKPDVKTYMDSEYYRQFPNQNSSLLHSETAPENARIGILGGESRTLNDSEYVYPFVELVGPNAQFPVSGNMGLRLRLGFSSACVAETNQLIYESDFQHVVVSFDTGVYTVYINGVLRQTLVLPGGCQAPNYPANPSSVLIGRSRQAFVAFSTAIREVRLYTNTNYVGAYISTTVDKAALVYGTTAKSIRLINTCVRLYSLNAYAGASEQLCGDEPDLTGQPTNGVIRSIEFGPRARAFNGKLDDVRLLGSALGASDAADLYYESFRQVELSLDEAPGAKRFRDNSFSDNSVTCDSAARRCPTSGVGGRVGQAARFDGINDVLVLGPGAVSVSSGRFGVAAWVKTSATGTQIIAQQRGPIPDRDDYVLEVNGGRAHWLSYSSGASTPAFNLTSTVVITDDQWHHVMGSGGGGEAQIYVDGVEVATDPSASGIVPSTGALSVTVGGDLLSNRRYFNGLLDDVKTVRDEATYGVGRLALLATAPNLSLHLDDADGARVFADDTRLHLDGGCFGAACAQPGAFGQVRGAATFDGIDDIITVPDTTTLRLRTFSVGFWVRPTEIRSGRQTLVSRGGYSEACSQDANDKNRNYFIGIEPMSMTLRFLAGQTPYVVPSAPDPGKPEACATLAPLFNLTTAKKLNLKQWNYVMATFDGSIARLYVNGSLAGSSPAVNPTAVMPVLPNAPVEIGRLYNAAGSDLPFRGELDELSIHGSALSARTIKQVYDYQAAWFDFSTGTRLTVDAERPTVSIDLNVPRVKLAQDTVLCALAADAASGVRSIEYSENGALWKSADIGAGYAAVITSTDGNGATITRTTTAAGAQRSAAGCFITPIVSSAGLKTMYARATDAVGLTQTTFLTFMVDGAGPVVTLAAGLQTGPRSAVGNTVLLTGTATDASGSVGSVTVALIDETGAHTSGALTATLTAGGWRADYPLSYAPHGAYTVALRAADDVGNVTLRSSDRISIDGAGPLADLTYTGPSTRSLAGVGDHLPRIAGTVADVPYPSNALLHLHFEEAAGLLAYADGSTHRRDAVCANTCGQAPGMLGQAVQIGAANALTVSDPITVSDFTLALWVKPQTAQSANLMARRAGANVQFQLRINAAGAFEAYASDGSARLISGTTPVVANTWYHVAAMATSQGALRLFVNGVEERTGVSLGALVDAGNEYLLGGLTPGAAGPFAGLLDEVLVYDYALRPDQIFAIARPTASGAQSVDVGLRHVKDFTDDAAIAWYPALMAPAGQIFGTWSFTLPEGVEGPFDIALRARDALGNERTALAAWSGEVDTLAPRVLLTTTIEGGRVRYTTTAQDYNLAAQGFNSACGADVTTGRRLYEADWYTQVMSPDKGGIKDPEKASLAAKLFELSATCLLDGTPSMAETAVVAMPQTRAVAASANALYALDSGVRVIAYDVTNPDRPIQRGEWQTRGAIGNLVVTGTLLLASTGNGIAIASIASPLQPVGLGSVTLAGPIFVWDFAVAGRYVYAAASQSGLRVIDIANPAAPVEIGALNTFGYAIGVAVSGTQAAVADWYGRLVIVNVASPSAPVELGRFDLAGSPQSVALRGSLAYVGSNKGLEIIDISNPAAPFLVAQLALPGIGARMVVSGTDAIVGLLDAGVAIVDVSNPFAPLLTRAFDTPGRVIDVAARGGRIYVANDRAFRVLNPLLRPASIAVDTAGNVTRLVLPALTKVQLAQLKSNPEAPLAEPDALNLQINSVPPLLSGVPYTLTGLAASTDGASFRTLSATVDGALIYTQSWTPGAALGIAWSGAWTPTGEGAHVVVLRAVDWVGASAEETATVVVDTLAPALGLSTTLFGPSQFGAQGAIDLRGSASDGSGIRDVIVRVDGQSLTATLDGANGWTARWQTGLGTLPDGLNVPIVITATDTVGRETVVSNGLLLDAAPPGAVAVSLSYTNSLGARVALAPGQTIYDVLTPTLLMTWTAALDAGGLDHYQAGWTGGVTLTALEVGGLVTTPPSMRDNAQAVGEARKVYAHVIATDLMGNQTESALGPVFVDYRRTDDYIALDDAEGIYRGWMSSGCALLGTDLRVSRSLPERSPLGVPQALYASWDASALRLAWQGADWDRDGDLFVYLAGPGAGTTSAYNPYAPARAITLPMHANRLVWVRGSNDWSFLNWTGSEWAVIAWPGMSVAFAPAPASPYTDLLLPFAALGVTDPATTTLGLLALAAEASPDGLRLWATLPRRNALNAARVVGLTEAAARATNGLGDPTRAYALALGADRCAQEAVYSGADLDVHASAIPAGQTSALYEDGWTASAGGLQSALIGSGDAIVYRFDIANLGVGPALNAAIVLTGDQINLGNATVGDHVWVKTVVLGDIAAGATRKVTVTGSVDLAAGAARGNRVRLDSALVFDHVDDAGDPLTYRRSEHAADVSPPTHLKVLPGSGLAGSGAQTVFGIVHDDGAVPTITLEVQAPGGGVTSVACPGALPGGSWQCGWDSGANPANDALFQLRAQATDAYGNQSGWTGWTNVRIDTQPVTISLSSDTTAGLSDGILSSGENFFFGRLDDNREVSRIDLCAAGGLSCAAAVLVFDEPTAQRLYDYDDAPEAPVPFDAPQQCLIGAPLTRTFTVSDSFTLADVSLGLNATLANRAALSATLRSPAGTRVALRVPGGAGGSDLDVRWDDSAATPLSADGASHNTGAPDYDNPRYPATALGAFDGQDAAGVWTLSVCTTDGQSGAYNHAQLSLERQAVFVNRGANWSHTVPLPEPADGLSQTILLNAYDLLGNRTGPLTLSFLADNVAPVLTLTAATATLPFTLGTAARPVLTGTVLDGGRVRSVFVTVRAPSGEVSAELTSGGTLTATNRPEAATPWRYDLQPNQSGVYALSVTAVDDAGNSVTIGTYEITVTVLTAPESVIYRANLPLITRGPAPALQLPASEPETSAPDPLLIAGALPPRPRPRWGAWLLTHKTEALFALGTPNKTSFGGDIPPAKPGGYRLRKPVLSGVPSAPGARIGGSHE